MAGGALRYRSCAECNNPFEACSLKASEMWQAGWGAEELAYELERSIYQLFMGGLSIFDSLVLPQLLRPCDKAGWVPRRWNLRAAVE
jgi:hypothetical protein